MNRNEQPRQLVDHLFRREAGKMIAVLTRIFGIANLELAEDVVQEAFLKALHSWKFNQLPDNPAGWLMTVAKNKALDVLRRQQKSVLVSDEVAEQLLSGTALAIDQLFLDHEMADSQLRMVFTCCNPALHIEDQVAFTLKTISGFGIKEIARALVSNEEVVRKRLYRAKEHIRKEQVTFGIPGGAELQERLAAVHTVLYLLFNEGYNSFKADELIRHDLCAEAMYLCKILSEHQAGKSPATDALLALMCLQACRFNSRTGENGAITLLQYQDRSQWDKALMNMGFYYLNRSSSGETLSVYHIESAIAAEHCMAASFADTDWKRVLQLYDLLWQHKPAPAVQLNRAVVLAQLDDVAGAIRHVLSIPNIEGLLKHHYLYNAVLGDFYLKAGRIPEGRDCLQRAMELTPSQAEKALLAEKLKA